MFDNFVNILIQIRFPILLLVAIFFLLSFFWNKLFTIFNLKAYSSIQKIHKEETSRVSGFLIYLFLIILCLLNYVESHLLINILIASIPYVIVGLKEDLLFNTYPMTRIASMIISCLVFFYINPIVFPVLDIPILGKAVTFYPINFLFFTFSILVVMNGMNLIDGMNGLFGLTATFQLMSLGFIGYLINDYEILKLSIIFLFPLILFLCFNFPLGRIFAGDIGAYFYGFLNSILTIYLIGKNDYLFSWIAVLILFYPCIELLFSFTRKLVAGTNPLNPDDKHLHSLLFKYYKNIFGKYICDISLLNSLVTLSLVFFWFLPFAIVVFSYQNLIYIISSIIILAIVYNCFYLYLLKRVRNNLFND